MLVQKLAAYEFLSTPSARRATIIGQELFFWCFISIHALREEGDPRKKSVHDKITDFYPRPPRGGRLGGVVVDAARHEFLSTPSARRATNAVQLILESLSISIHALREEGDETSSGAKTSNFDFYPRPPRGGRLKAFLKGKPIFLFLSTPSARRAT